ncbi:hydroxymethylbilane synthase [Acetitomaculum ruminis DSM 5522]|uniref:Porphobilinogen deaminase n=1 Tax=Acetitomaculum ruminis DSM 5522 TaxID=1120918 RepID=A0A1I0Z0S7_9FIRM|nr:hydroxymethylbilane synthase [Acetitomaculum ruminis]SFB18220.1 hydroxymethylbilane synthase [Acetitomaculum ruminis DSM 5522]
MRKVTAGSRESKLAVIQTEMVMDFIKEHNENVEPVMLTMKTTGDIILDRTLDKVGGKGLFVKELDKALMEKKSDFSVHSLKDMPMEVPDELPLIAFSKREDPRDVFVLPKGVTKWENDKPIGCSSLRRTLQLQKIFPDATFESVRGNVITRLRKLDEGQYSALILAAAGLKRLGFEDRISRYFTTEEMIPSAGQGIIAVQGRIGEDYSYLKDFNDEKSAYAATAERAFVKYLDGGCSSPIAAHAIIDGDELSLSGLYYSEDDRNYVTGKVLGNVKEAEELGIKLAKELKDKINNK